MSNQPSYRLLSNISFNSIPILSYHRWQRKDQDILSSKEKSDFAKFFLPVSPIDLSFEPESLQVFNHKSVDFPIGVFCFANFSPSLASRHSSVTT